MLNLKCFLCIYFFSSGTMNDIKGKWSTLGKDEKHKYCQEAAALRAHGQAQDLSPEMRGLRIKMHLKKLKFEVWKEALFARH